MLIMPPMSDDHHYRQREYDYYHDRRASDHYHDRRERDHYRRKRERDTLANDSAEALYNPLAAGLRVTVLVAALWLVVTVLSMAEAIAYDWWRSVFVIAAIIALLGLGRELLFCLIRSVREKRLALLPLISGLVVGMIAAGVLHLAGVMAAVASALANAPPV